MMRTSNVGMQSRKFVAFPGIAADAILPAMMKRVLDMTVRSDGAQVEV